MLIGYKSNIFLKFLDSFQLFEVNLDANIVSTIKPVDLLQVEADPTLCLPSPSPYCSEQIPNAEHKFRPNNQVQHTIGTRQQYLSHSCPIT